ncbi:SDR family NAD(P)-dependent oxidoreductase [Micromonospora yasonensis]|uniref:SDR family NAD(P)-dependent oxidoreductase n=1 Tax=Micromonospora yasonensis TaxID=1128667 RepID=UPI00222E06F1|nr:SDR family NAD(P)-dependent oxidoreductase [Micromonospora yasonensis]MCW3842088.1 SDR family NAD(P)-dependent oxidoreductase [Micromonospora yasonensis]
MEDLTERRIVVVTGASSGIGLAAAVDLARRGDQVVLVGRDPARLQAAGDRLREASGERPELFRADFAVLDDVRRLAEKLRAAYDRIDVLANNAGAIVLQPVTTVNGFELSIQANHLAPFLLSNLLRDRIGRMVVTASGAHRSGVLDPDDLNATLRGFRPYRAYGTSKQANILFAAEAARRWPEVPAYSFHPGVVRTRFGADSPLVSLGMRLLPFRSPEKGAETLIWLANQDPSRLTSGGYYFDRRPRRPLAKARDPQLAARLWTVSAQAVGIDA